MKSVSKRKIANIKQVHILPNIFFILIGLASMLVLLATVFMLFTSILLFSKVNFTAQNMNIIANDIQSLSDEQCVAYFDSFSKNPLAPESVYVFNQHGKTIAGYGTPSIDLSENIYINFGVPYNLYLDSNDSEGVRLNNASIPINIGYLSTQFLNPDNIRPDGEIARFNYWLADSNSNLKGKVIFVKGTIIIHSNEVLPFVFCIFFAFLIIVIVFWSMLSNVISRFVERRKIIKALYMDIETGGNNWLYFEDMVTKKLRSFGATKQSFAIVDFDIMKYRNYCSCYGVEAGREYLENVEKFLSKKVGRREICAHYSKASFAALIYCFDKEDAINRVREWMDSYPSNDNIRRVFHCGIYFVEPEVDEKGTYHRRKNINVAQLYSNAGTARANISPDVDNEVFCFNQQMLDQQLWESKVEANMVNALRNEEFKVYIQPKYSPADESLMGAEALIRWVSPVEGFISPGKFIPIFEKNGFITQIDDYMISHVAAYQAKWLSEGKKIVPISVNVSRAHFAQPDLAEHICNLVDQYDLPHKYIEIELTESAFFDDKNALLSTVNSLKNMGFALSMDDFGSGYSSLNSLKDLPLDILKLDAEFFRGESDKERSEIVVAEAIHLAQNLDMRIVAEGVEKKDQVDFLAKVGCDMIQGFYYSKPVPTDEYESKLG